MENICPLCEAEYREEALRCSDCNAALVPKAEYLRGFEPLPFSVDLGSVRTERLDHIKQLAAALAQAGIRSHVRFAGRVSAGEETSEYHHELFVEPEREAAARRLDRALTGPAARVPAPAGSRTCPDCGHNVPATSGSCAHCDDVEHTSLPVGAAAGEPLVRLCGFPPAEAHRVHNLADFLEHHDVPIRILAGKAMHDASVGETALFVPPEARDRALRLAEDFLSDYDAAVDRLITMSDPPGWQRSGSRAFVWSLPVALVLFGAWLTVSALQEDPPGGADADVVGGLVVMLVGGACLAAMAWFRAKGGAEDGFDER
jgi:hypothetical protein